ncbi:MAG: LEA type 2 family protein [Flavobacteriales bacterium]|nr:LEA type 2 family protein [Flavobacteriales bacterium]
MSIGRFVRVLLLVGLMFSFQGCFDYEDVDFKGVQGVSVVERTDEVVKLQIDVKVDNPNNFKIKVKKSTLDIYINEKYIGKTSLDSKIVINKNSEEVYPIVLNADPKDLIKAAMGSLGGLLKGSVKVRLKGDVKGSVYGVTRKVPVDFEEEINLKDLM